MTEHVRLAKPIEAEELFARLTMVLEDAATLATDGQVSGQCKVIQMDRAMKAKIGGKEGSARAVAISSGGQLVREWNGRHYQFDVLGDQYVLDGRAFASLTAVAKHITGTNWSGPRFFRLNKSRKAAR